MPQRSQLLHRCVIFFFFFLLHRRGLRVFLLVRTGSLIEHPPLTYHDVPQEAPPLMGAPSFDDEAARKQLDACAAAVLSAAGDGVAELLRGSR